MLLSFSGPHAFFSHRSIGITNWLYQLVLFHCTVCQRESPISCSWWLLWT